MLGRFWVALALLCAGTTAAHAQQVYLMSGKAARSFSGFDLPLAGDTDCGDLTLQDSGESRHHFGGCIPGAAKVTATAPGVGKQLGLPANAFGQPLPDAPRVFTIPNSNDQITTSLAVGIDQAGQLRADAWSTQAGRAAADFTWSLDNVNTRLAVKYTAGPNRFGGTIGFALAAGPNPSRLVLRQVGPGVTFVPIDAIGARPTGCGYAAAKTDPSSPGSAWGMTMATAMGRITMATTYLGPRPLGGSRKVHGFPFTTGQVVVRRTGSTLGPAKSPATLTLSATGGDSITSMGARQLTLVAGSIATTSAHGSDLGLTQVVLPEPDAMSQAVAGILGLVALGAWRARRSC